MEHTVLVMAGTPTDTQMGVAFLAQHGIEGIACPVSENPIAQTAFQISSAETKHQVVRELLLRGKAEGCVSAFIYCNSLSGSVDFPRLAQETGLHIVTPLAVYRSYAGRYHSLGVIAANAQGCAGIERTLLEVQPTLTLRSVGLLPLVLDIEKQISPQELVKRHGLAELCAWFTACACEAVVLGCTHFPYVKEALQSYTTLPLLDPAVEMMRLL